ncbi:MAG TPA: sodium/solute symporter [Steroidobacteraceae bacterium]|nr:sodium/solute symporter [Steroidobacteraceae bacterium]
MRAILALVALTLSATAAAKSISSVDVTSLPALDSASTPARVIAIDDRPVVLQPGVVRVLHADRKGWNEIRRPDGLSDAPTGIVTDGRQTFVLDGAKVAQLKLNADVLTLHALPALPAALTSAVGAFADDTLYVAGLDASGTPHLLQLAIASEAGQWSALAAWPGSGAPTSIVSRIGSLYLTLRSEGDAADRLLRWSPQKGWQDRGIAPGAIVPGSAHAVGQAHILYLLRDQTGASRLETFHTISSAWAEVPYRRSAGVDSVTAIGNGVLMTSAAGGRVDVENAQLVSSKRGLSGISWTIVILYLGAMIGVGVYWYLRDRQGTSSEFFLGSRAIPFWAAGVSLYATNTSSISYLAIPAKAFETDWQYMMNKLITILGLMFVAVWIVPLLRRLDLVSVFNYLEMRFHPAIRMIGSALCMAMHVGGRMSVVLFLPALAIATITGIDVVYSILIMGVCTIVYTAMGGMRAVVWTDFVQVIVLMGGALFAIFFIFHALGSDAIFATAKAFDKTKLVNFSFDLTQPTIWGFLFLILFDVVLTFPKDQVLMQRTLATDSPKAAGRSVWMFAAIMLPGGLIFYGIGTVLFAYYKAHPERLDPLLPIDATFPLFISAELPAGLTGLIIAGIFAAAMGTLSGTINSVATLLSVDFYQKLARDPTEHRTKRFAEWMTVVVGLVGIGLALLLSRLDIHSLLDLTIEMAGLLGGGFAGAYTLGMFTRRANSAGVSIGVATAIVVTLTAWWYQLVHPYFYLGISIFVCIAVGYVASLFFPPPTRSLAGLTIYKDA